MLVGSGFFDQFREDTRIGTSAPELALPRVDPTSPEIQTLALNDLRGRVVLLDFWATWCPPCRASIPRLSELTTRFANRPVSVLGINTEGLPPASVRRAQHQLGARFPSLLDDGRAVEAFQVSSLPTLLLIGKDGRIRRAEIGVPDLDEWSRAVERALEEPDHE